MQDMLTFSVCTLSYGVYAISSHVAENIWRCLLNRQKNVVRLHSRPTKVIFDEVVLIKLYHSKQYYGVCTHHVSLGNTTRYTDQNMVIMLGYKSRTVFFDGVISLEWCHF